MLTALTQQCGSFFEAVQRIGKVLNVKGQIIPATTQVISLYAIMEDGVIVKGEANIPNRANHIRQVFYEEDVSATPEAIEAIKKADLIIYGIGSVYTSILPNIIIPDIQAALDETKAKRVYFCNAMTQPGETDGYCVEDHVKALKRHGAPVDAVMVSKDTIPASILQRYEQEGSTQVTLKEKEHAYEIIEEELLSFENDLIRHDSAKVEKAVQDIVEGL
jgi:uncharacterized cofD-like protein